MCPNYAIVCVCVSLCEFACARVCDIVREQIKDSASQEEESMGEIDRKSP